MVLRGIKKIDGNLLVSQIVISDYRTADVFRKHSIDFYRGNKWSLEEICEIRQIDTAILKKELEESICTVCLPNALKFGEWNIDFLTDYIIHVHHQYLQKALPEAKDYLLNFIKTGTNEFHELSELTRTFMELSADLFPHLQEEELIIFPYITQIAHAYYSKEPYAGLLVRTLRKPVENVMQHEHELVNQALCKMRKLTNNYSFRGDASVIHQVAFLKLLELDNDLVQHMHLENDILFPRAIALEKELLQRKE